MLQKSIIFTNVAILNDDMAWFSLQGGSSRVFQGLREPYPGCRGFLFLHLFFFFFWPFLGQGNIFSRFCDYTRVLLEEKKNVSSPASGALSQPLSDDSITRDCVTWTPLPTQYRYFLFGLLQLTCWVTFQRQARSQKVREGSDRVGSSQEREFSEGGHKACWKTKCRNMWNFL